MNLVFNLTGEEGEEEEKKEVQERLVLDDYPMVQEGKKELLCIT